jgi:hypothetical protein
MKYIALIAITVLSFLACKKQKSYDYFSFKGKVGGQDLIWMAQARNNYTDGTFGAVWLQDVKPVFGGDCIANQCYDMKLGTNVHNLLTNSPAALNNMDVFIVQPVSNSFTYDTILPLFNPGVKAFGKERTVNTQTGTTGAVVVYTDGAGKIWRSDGGPQSSSSFTSESFTDETQPSTYKKVWKAKFTCLLYNNGQSIEASNCEIYGPVLKN